MMYIRVLENAIWINECPSNISKTYEYGLQGVLMYLAIDDSGQIMHLLAMARTLEIPTNGFGSLQII